MTRKWLFPLFLLAGVCPSVLDAQDARDDLTLLAERLADYGRYYQEMETDSLLELIDPEFFAIVPREMFAANFERMKASGTVECGYEDFTVLSIGETLRYRGEDYCPVEYRISFRRRVGEPVEVKQKKLFAIRRGDNAPWHFVEYLDGQTAMNDLVVPTAVLESLRF